MIGLSVSKNEFSCFIFFEQYGFERFESFVEVVTKALGAKEIKREHGPYSSLITIEYDGENLLLTGGSFEGCFISMEKGKEWLVDKVVQAFRSVIVSI